MAAIHKKHEEHKAEEETSNKREEAASAKSDLASGEPKPVVVSDVVTESTERIEVIEEVAPEETKSEPPVEATPTDPLADFKEKMVEEESLPSDEPPKKNFMWPILFVFIIALVLLGGIFAYKKGMNKTEKVNVVTLSPTPTLTPQPTIVLSKYAIKILNGSGVDGEAGRQKTALEAAGFTISSVGNADNSNYTDTIIEAKKDIEKAFLDKLKSVLQTSFTLSDVKVLPDNSTSSVIVILGTKK